MCADGGVTSVVLSQDTAVFAMAWPACLLGDGVAAAGASPPKMTGSDSFELPMMTTYEVESDQGVLSTAY